MELELKHLAPYLPYELKLQYIVRDKVERIGTLKSITHNEDETHPTKVSISYMYDEEHIWMFKPILEPLSNLTKPITRNGVTFVAHEKLGNRPNLTDFTIEEVKNNIGRLSYDLVQQLIEWKFDVFGLIEQGKAIECTNEYN